MAKRTIRIRSRKSRTIRKVMRGCNGRGRGRGKRGGGEAVQYAGASPVANANLAAMQAGIAQANQAAGNSPPSPPKPIESNMGGGQATTTTAPITEPSGVGGNVSSTYGQVGGSHHSRRSKTRHHKRKLRYKKSVARKSRRS